MPEHPAPDTQHLPQQAPPPRPMSIRARGRSFMALVLSPEAPLDAWLGALDDQISRSPAFLAGKPIILDLCHLTEDADGLDCLQAALLQRAIRPVSIEGGQRNWPALSNWDWPVTLSGGRDHELPDPETDICADDPASGGDAPEGPQSSTLFVDEPVRSGQIVTWLEGDIVVTGGVASGAELVAAGNIHIYGALRGRAIAGVGGNSQARILARRMFAELLAIDGFYMTAEEIDQQSVGQPAQARLVDDRIVMQPLT